MRTPLTHTKWCDECNREVHTLNVDDSCPFCFAEADKIIKKDKDGNIVPKEKKNESLNEIVQEAWMKSQTIPAFCSFIASYATVAHKHMAFLYECQEAIFPNKKVSKKNKLIWLKEAALYLKKSSEKDSQSLLTPQDIILKNYPVPDTEVCYQDDPGYYYKEVDALPFGERKAFLVWAILKHRRVNRIVEELCTIGEEMEPKEFKNLKKRILAIAKQAL